MRTPTDIFPDIDIPVVAVVWSYTGLSPDDMAGRIVGLYERALTTTVNDVEHVESNSETNYGIVKIFFQPTASSPPAQHPAPVALRRATFGRGPAQRGPRFHRAHRSPAVGRPPCRFVPDGQNGVTSP